MKKPLLVLLATLLVLFAAGCSDDAATDAVTSYIVAFDTMGGSWIFPQLVPENGTVSEPAPPTRAGYTFAGWFRDQACLNAWYFGSDTIFANTTIYAKWTGGGGGGDNYVFFNTLGGSGIGTQIIATGGYVTEPVQYPDKSGYIFEGWYKEEACLTPWNFSVDTVSGQTTIYAKWTTTPLSWTTNSGIVISGCNSSFSGHLNLPNYINGHPVTRIGNYAFLNAENLSSITFPPFLYAIGEGAFATTKLVSVTIPECVQEIGVQAFNGCVSLTSITLPEGLLTLEWGAFSDCTALTSIVIPDAITTINIRTFHNCVNLSSVTMPANLEAIANEVFLNCPLLTSLTIPAGVTSIGTRAFSGCTGLTTLNMYPTTAPTLGTTPFLNVSGCTLNLTGSPSGYDVNPWTDVAIFSSVNYSL